MLSRRLLCLLFVVAALGGAARASAGMSSLESGGSARVTEVIDGDTVVLSDTRQVRLVGLQAPKLPLGRKNFPKWPLADEAKATLENLALERDLELRYGGQRVDRHGRILAHLYRKDGLWIQGEMLRLGFARVYTFSDNRALAKEMYALEREARAAQRSIWGHAYYAVRTVGQLAAYIDTFQLVEGRVLAVAQVKGRTYLNFGPDWRTDFTVAISAKSLKAFRATGMAPIALKDKRVRIRGWLKRENGPMIEATHPEQIEFLELSHQR